MSEVLKLKEPGSSVTLHVTACALAPTGKYPELLITGHDGAQVVTLGMPASSADRQLKRLKPPMTYADCVGMILRIGRGDDPNATAGGPYWNLDVLGSVEDDGGAATPPARPAVPSSPPAPQPAKPLDVARLKREAEPFMQPEPPSQHVEGLREAFVGAPPALRGHALYLECAEWYFTNIVPRLVAQGITPTHEGTGAGIAALFIEANKR